MSNTRFLISVAIFAASLMAATMAIADQSGISLPKDPIAGQQLFIEKRCILCHSVQGVGGKTGPDLGEIWLGSFMEITSKLWNHFPRMNEAFRQLDLQRPTLSAEEAQRLITYLYFLNYFDKTASAVMGEKLFREKNCFFCHSVGGKGGKVGPALDPYQGRYAVPFITASLWNKGPKMMQTMLKKHVPRPSFEDKDVMDILAFIREKGRFDNTSRQYVPLGDPTVGEKMFQAKGCTNCHSIHGQGGTLAPDLTTRGLKGGLSHILSEMWNHGSKMWPMMEKERIEFPRFTAREMSDLMTYLYFLEFQDPQGSVTRGKQVFVEKQCAVCHLAAVPGGATIGPDLSKVGLEQSINIVAEMWNHAPGIEERMKQGQIRWPLLDKDEMRDLVQYILSLNAKS
jgi:cytochrome c2